MRIIVGEINQHAAELAYLVHNQALTLSNKIQEYFLFFLSHYMQGPLPHASRKFVAFLRAALHPFLQNSVHIMF